MASDPPEQASGQVFIELDEFFPQAAKWQETHRWNFGMEEDLEGGRWVAPHLPTVSARALSLLLASMPESSFLLEGSAPAKGRGKHDLGDIARSVLDMLSDSGKISSAERAEALAALASKPTNSRGPRVSAGDVLAPGQSEEALEILVIPVLDDAHDTYTIPVGFVRCARAIDDVKVGEFSATRRARRARFLFRLRRRR